MPCEHGLSPETSSVVHSSTSAGDHSHGKLPQNTANRRTCDKRAPIVLGFSIRETCCADQPVSMSSKTCSAGRSNATLPARNAVTDPARFPSSKSTPTVLHLMYEKYI